MRLSEKRVNLFSTWKMLEEEYSPLQKKINKVVNNPDALTKYPIMLHLLNPPQRWPLSSPAGAR